LRSHAEIRVHLAGLLRGGACGGSPALPQGLHLPDARPLRLGARGKRNRNAALRTALRSALHGRSALTQLFDMLVHYLGDPLCERFYITEERYV
jgi:hypothetical protein